MLLCYLTSVGWDPTTYTFKMERFPDDPMVGQVLQAFEDGNQVTSKNLISQLALKKRNLNDFRVHGFYWGRLS